MLLKLEAGELVSERLPRATIAGHRFGLRAIRRVARVITDSSSARDDFLRFQDYPAERVIAIPLAASPFFHPPAVRESYPPREFTILHVGHSGFYKNIEAILCALPLVQVQLERPVRFCKVGGRLTLSQQELIAKLGISGSVETLGTLSDNALAQVYRTSDVLVMPSLHEGFGLPILEAMASGTPVVASNRGSLPEVVGDAGLIVEPDDIEAIADAVVRLITDPKVRDEMIARGIDRSGQFTWERTARATLDVYRAVVAEAS
jgi:glycosyltransferase involved in cell wall biosynthesis